MRRRFPPRSGSPPGGALTAGLHHDPHGGADRDPSEAGSRVAAWVTRCLRQPETRQ